MDVDAASMDSLEQLELRLADYGWHKVTYTPASAAATATPRCQHYPPSVPTHLRLNSIPSIQHRGRRVGSRLWWPIAICIVNTRV